MRYAAIMLSRQPLRPTSLTPWVRRSVEAIRWLRDNEMGLVSSIGMQTWELVSTLARDASVPLCLVIPCASSDDFRQQCDRATADFDLSGRTLEFVATRERSDDLQIAPVTVRDRTVVELADLLLPVSCRPGGQMSALLEEARARGKSVDDRFVALPERSVTALKNEPDDRPLNPTLREAEGRYLIHWTRGVSTPWPGEPKVKFYRDVVRFERWPRTALDTLRRIIHMRTILASTRHMPGRTPAVSLTSLSPLETVPLMRWRARYRQMSFEPYGLGIRRTLAQKLGIEEVRYFDPEEEAGIPDGDRWRWQSTGKITPWRREHEYRCRGDLDLSALSEADMALFCRTGDEAHQLRLVHASPVWSLLP